MKIETKFSIGDEVKVKSLEEKTGELVYNTGKISGIRYQKVFDVGEGVYYDIDFEGSDYVNDVPETFISLINQ